MIRKLADDEKVGDGAASNQQNSQPSQAQPSPEDSSATQNANQDENQDETNTETGISAADATALTEEDLDAKEDFGRRLSTTKWSELGYAAEKERKQPVGPLTIGKGELPLDKDWKESKSAARYEITVLNVGDSRAIVIDSSGRIFPMTQDHKPNLPKEARRVQLAGGTVMYNRVDGELAMSRAFGDWPYKRNPALSTLEQKVIAAPDVSRKIVSANDQLVVCCDGFFETLSAYEVGKFLHNNRGRDPAAVMAALCQHSLTSGSKDNMSGVLCYFQEAPVKGFSREYRWGPLSLQSSRNSQFSKVYKADALKHGIPEAEVNKVVNETSFCTIS
jgi:serine/threonine protein phosphatase PrpC